MEKQEEKLERRGADPNDKRNQQRVEAFAHGLKRRGLLDRTCLFCGQIGLSVLGDGPNDPMIPLSPASNLSYTVYAVACNHCGFVHTFVEHIFDTADNESE